jgi:sugar phosphate permease
MTVESEGIGSALSPSLFAWMIPRVGWRTSFAIAGVATALVAIAWSRSVADFPISTSPHISQGASASELPSRRRLRANDLKRLLGNRDVLLLSAGYCAVGYFEYIFFFWIYYYLGQIRGMNSAQTSVYSTAMFLSWVVMTPVGVGFPTGSRGLSEAVEDESLRWLGWWPAQYFWLSVRN